MKQYEGTLAIALRREDGLPWPDEYADITDTGNVTNHYCVKVDV